MSLLEKGYRSAEVEIPVLQEMWKKPVGKKFVIGRAFLPFLERIAKDSLALFGIPGDQIQKGAVTEEAREEKRPGDYLVSRKFFCADGQTIAELCTSYSFHNPRDGDGLGISVNLSRLPEPVEGVSFHAAYWLHQDDVRFHVSGYHLTAERMTELIAISGNAFGCKATVVGGLTPEDHL